MKYVYLIKAGQAHYKVGVAKNVTRRVKELQTSNPTRMEVVAVRLVDDAYRIENSIHQKLEPYRSGPGREWFELPDSVVIDLAIDLNREPEIDMTQQITVREILLAQDARQKSIERDLAQVISEYRRSIPPPFEEPVNGPVPRVDPEKVFQQQLEDDVDAAKTVIARLGRASTSSLQREMRIGYGRAARIIDALEKSGHITKADGNRPRALVAHQDQQLAN